MKTIFEGKVNGVVYNNVNDYNVAIAAAMSSGQSVIASTCTKTVDEPINKPKIAKIEQKCESGHTCECGQDCDKVTCKCNKPILFCGFDTDQHYLDIFHGTPTDRALLTAWEDKLTNNIDKVEDILDNFTESEIKKYGVKLEKVMEYLQQDKKDISRMEKEIQSELTNLKAQKTEILDRLKDIDKKLADARQHEQLMVSCAALNNKMISYYNTITESAADKLTKFDNKCDSTTHNHCNNIKSITQEEIQKMLDSIFNKD
jgi:hypothetical protein